MTNFTNEEIFDSIKHNEWFIINAGMNLARLKAFNYYVDSGGEKQWVNHSEVDGMYDMYSYEILKRARAILSLKDELTEERVSDSTEFNTHT